ncbi:MAG: hypothetical protein WB696_16290 [Chthoniobacterales bacterium]
MESREKEPVGYISQYRFRQKEQLIRRSPDHPKPEPTLTLLALRSLLLFASFVVHDPQSESLKFAQFPDRFRIAFALFRSGV